MEKKSSTHDHQIDAIVQDSHRFIQGTHHVVHKVVFSPSFYPEGMQVQFFIHITPRQAAALSWDLTGYLLESVCTDPARNEVLGSHVLVSIVGDVHESSDT